MVNAGFSAGIAQRGAAERIAWALSGAPKRKKDLRLTPLAAMAEARKLRDRVTEIMLKGDLRPEDAAVACVYAKSDLSDLSGPPVFIAPEEKTSEELESLRVHMLDTPIGLLVLVIDRQGKVIRGHARPFILDDRSLHLNEKALNACMQILDDYKKKK